MGKHRVTAGATYGRNGSFFLKPHEMALAASPEVIHPERVRGDQDLDDAPLAAAGLFAVLGGAAVRRNRSASLGNAAILCCRLCRESQLRIARVKKAQQGDECGAGDVEW